MYELCGSSPHTETGEAVAYINRHKGGFKLEIHIEPTDIY
jgi:hypothetical protein